MISEIFVGFQDIFGYTIMAFLIFIVLVVLMSISRGLGFIATIIVFVMGVFLLYSKEITDVPIVTLDLAIPIFIIFGLFFGFLVYNIFVER